MENFEKKRQEYFEKQKEDDEIFNMLINNPNNNPDILNIIIMPETPKELELAEAIIDFFIMIYSIQIGEYESTLKLEDSQIIKLYIYIITALKNNDEVTLNKLKEYFKSVPNPKQFASMIYDFYCVVFNYSSEYVDYIAKECNYDIYNNDDDDEEFNNYFEEAKRITNGTILPMIDFSKQSIENNEQINHFIATINELRSIYENKKGKEYTK